MSLRVTRQYVDVLGPGDGKLRVTRQFVDVLGPGDGKLRITRQYVDVLGAAVVEWAGVGTNALDFAQTAAVTHDIGIVVEDTLGFVQVGAGTVDIFETAAHSLGLGDLAAGVAIYNCTADLELADAAIAVVAWNRSVTQSLALADSIDYRGPVYVAIHHGLSFITPVVGHVGIINETVHDTMSLVDQAGRVYLASANSTLAFLDIGARRKTGIAQSTLAFVQTVAVGKSKLATSVVVLSQAVVLEAILKRGVVDDLGLVHSGTYQLVGPSCLTRQYRPFVGFSTDTEITPPNVSAPVLSDATLTLMYPFVSPTHTLILRNPEFGNKDRLMFNRVNRQTRGGTLVIYADSQWPKTQVLQVEVRGLKPPQVIDLLAFFAESLGQEVGLLDHENRQWRGIITNPDTPVANPARGDATVTFEFEGELV